MIAEVIRIVGIVDHIVVDVADPNVKPWFHLTVTHRPDHCHEITFSVFTRDGASYRWYHWLLSDTYEEAGIVMSSYRQFEPEEQSVVQEAIKKYVGRL